MTKTEDEEGDHTLERQTKTAADFKEKEAAGTLTFNTGESQTFVLLITGTKSYELSGDLLRTRMTQMMFNHFKVSKDDTEAVSRVDLKILAKKHGARPGWGADDSNMDFNCNCKIDIADLATVAAVVESTK